MVHLSDLQTKNIVSVTSGKNIGNIIDANISDKGEIISLIIESNKKIFSLNKTMDTEIKWQDIVKIGEDVILVKSSGFEEWRSYF